MQRIPVEVVWSGLAPFSNPPYQTDMHAYHPLVLGLSSVMTHEVVANQFTRAW